jgi:hypothetical protein
MWVTQTYLEPAQPSAGVFIYYMFENYNTAQASLTKQVQVELGSLGEVYGSQVSLHMPNPRYANAIEGQVREIRPLWNALQGKLPGLLVTTKPMVELTEFDSSTFYIRFSEEQPKEVAKTIHDVRQLTERLKGVDPAG